MTDEIKYWKISPGKGGMYWENFRDTNSIQIGWLHELDSELDIRETNFGDLTKNHEQELVEKVFLDYYKGHIEDPDYEATERKVKKWAEKFRPFLEIDIGDKVVVYDKGKKINALCKVVDKYDHKPDGRYTFPHIKKVKWLRKFSPPLEIRSIEDKFETKIWLPATVIEMNENDWNLIYEFSKPKYQDEETSIEHSDVVTHDLLLSKKQIILYGPPGTGKTYNAREFAVRFIKEETHLDKPIIPKGRKKLAISRSPDEKTIQMIIDETKKVFPRSIGRVTAMIIQRIIVGGGKAHFNDILDFVQNDPDSNKRKDHDMIGVTRKISELVGSDIIKGKNLETGEPSRPKTKGKLRECTYYLSEKLEKLFLTELYGVED